MATSALKSLPTRIFELLKACICNSAAVRLSNWIFRLMHYLKCNSSEPGPI